MIPNYLGIIAGSGLLFVMFIVSVRLGNGRIYYEFPLFCSEFDSLFS